MLMTLFNQTAEKHFEEQVVLQVTKIDLMGNTLHFIGIKFQWEHHDDSHLTCHLSQEAFVDNLVEIAELCLGSIAFPPMTYWCGPPIDSTNSNTQ
eukprot:15339210-Ditylum_brightwellii.AAC.1